MPGIIIPPAGCHPLAGKNGRLWVALNPADEIEGHDIESLDFVRVGGLNNYSRSHQETRIDDPFDGMMRSLKIELGETLVVAGNFDPLDAGQAKVEQLAYRLGCDGRGFFRFRINGIHAGDPPATDRGYWVVGPSLSDLGAAQNANFTWGASLVIWGPRTDDGVGIDLRSIPPPSDELTRVTPSSTSVVSAQAQRSSAPKTPATAAA